MLRYGGAGLGLDELEAHPAVEFFLKVTPQPRTATFPIGFQPAYWTDEIRASHRRCGKKHVAAAWGIAWDGGLTIACFFFDEKAALIGRLLQLVVLLADHSAQDRPGKVIHESASDLEHWLDRFAAAGELPRRKPKRPMRSSKAECAMKMRVRPGGNGVPPLFPGFCFIATAG